MSDQEITKDAGDGEDKGKGARYDGENEALLVIDEDMLINALADDGYELPSDADERAKMLNFIGNNLVKGYSEMVLGEARDQAIEWLDGTIGDGKGDGDDGAPTDLPITRRLQAF